MSNTRIRAIAPGVKAERIATETHITYDPMTQNAEVVFQGEEFLVVGDDLGSKLNGRQSLTVEISAIAGETFDAGVDPVTQADLSMISVAGISNLIRAIYDRKHNDAYRVP